MWRNGVAEPLFDCCNKGRHLTSGVVGRFPPRSICMRPFTKNTTLLFTGPRLPMAGAGCCRRILGSGGRLVREACECYESGPRSFSGLVRCAPFKVSICERTEIVYESPRGFLSESMT